MKTTRALLGSFFAVAALTAGLPLGAQTVQFITVDKAQHFDQTTSSAPTATTNGFSFEAGVDGQNMTATNPLTAVTVTGGPLTNQPLTAPSAMGSSNWKYKVTNYASQSALDTAYANGNYTFTLTGTPSGTTPNIVMGTAPTATQLATPLLTLTGGTGDMWSGGVYNLNSTHALTISFNQVFSGTAPASTQGFHYDVNINGPNSTSITTPQGFLNYDPTTSTSGLATTPPNFTINANTLVAGQTYTFDISYQYIESPLTNVLATGVTAAALYTRTTSFTVMTAVPEPSTYAAIFGVVALAGVMIHRRRRVTA